MSKKTMVSARETMALTGSDMLPKTFLKSLISRGTEFLLDAHCARFLRQLFQKTIENEEL
jgi:hypothetical protein